MDSKIKAKIALVLRCLLGLLFIIAAIGKLKNPQDFLVSIRAYELPLPEMILSLTAIVLPWLELICGLLLLPGFWKESSLTIITGLMVVFLFATGQAWMRGLNIDCGCFGSNLEETTFLGSVAFAFMRNLVLLTVSIWLLRRALKDTGLSPENSPAS